MDCDIFDLQISIVYTNINTHGIVRGISQAFIQWPFQEPKLEVPTIYKAYISGLNFREYSHKIWPKIWYIYIPPSVGS